MPTHRLARPLQPADIHPHDCDCPEHVDAPAPRLTSLDLVSLQIVVGFAIGFLVCEIYALLTGAAHVTVVIGAAG